MSLKKASLIALTLCLSYDSFGATPVIRAGSLRLNKSAQQTSAPQSVSAAAPATTTSSSYNRASSLRPSRVQISSGNKDEATEELLNKVYEEMEKVTNAVEQELYVTNKQIKDLKDEIAERDEKIKELEASLDEYDDIKQTVKDLPMLYYSKKEVDAKGYVMPSTLNTAMETAKNTAKSEALAEVDRKGFITSSAVASEIANAKNAAVDAAVSQIETMNFATVSTVTNAESRMISALNDTKTLIANERNAVLSLYAKSADVTSEITMAKNTAIADAKSQTLTAIENKNFATKTYADEKYKTALNDAKTYTNTKINEEAISTQAALDTINSRFSSYTTHNELANAIQPENIANGLLNNTDFKTKLVSSINNNVTDLTERVDKLETQDTAINNKFSLYSTKQELHNAVNNINNTINNLDFDIYESDLNDIIDQRLSDKKVVQEDTLATVRAFKSVKDTVDAIPNNYYNQSAINQLLDLQDRKLNLYSTKQELQTAVNNINDTINNLDFDIDDSDLNDIIDQRLSDKKVVREDTLATVQAFKSVKDIVDAIPDNYYSKSKVDQKIAEAATGGEIDLSGYLAKDELIGALKKISDTEICLTKNCVSGQVADGLSGLDFDIDDSDLNDIIDQRLSDKKVVREDTLATVQAFKNVKDTVDAIPKNYYNMSTVDQKIAEAATGGEIDLSGYLAKDELIGALKKISDTEICLTKNCVSGQVADGLSGLEFGVDEDTVGGIIENKLPTIKAFKDVKDIVDAIPDNYYNMSTVDEKIAEAATGGEIDLSGYLRTSEFTAENVTKLLNGRFMTSSDTVELLKDYATKTELNSYVLKNTLQDDIEGLNKFVTVETVEDLVTEKVDPDNIATNLLQNDKFKTDLIAGVSTDVSSLKTRVEALEAEDANIYNKFASYYTKTETDDAIDGAVSAEREARTKAGYLTNSSLTSYATKDYVDTAVSAEREARTKAGYLTNSSLDGYATEEYVNTKVAEEATARNSAVSAEREARTKAGYLTNSSLDGYATEEYVNTKVAEEATARNSAIAAAKSAAITDAEGKIATAKDEAIAQAATAADKKYATKANLQNEVNTAIGKSETITSLQTDVETANSTAETAKSTAETAKSTAETAKSTAATAQSTAERAATAVQTLESKALTVENYCTNKPTECTDGGIGTDGK